MTTAIVLELLKSALSIWDNHEKNKYLDQYLELEKDFYAEWNKDVANRSDAVLDNIDARLRQLIRGFTSAVGSANATPKP